MLRTEFLHHSVDVFHALCAGSHCLSREVGVAAGSIPIWKEFRGERDVYVVVLSDSGKEITCHPKVVTHFNSKAWSYLEFPLSWHYLSICSGNVNASNKASSVVHVRDDSAEADVCADGAVVWSLRSRVTIGRPSEWPFRELVGSAK